MCHVPPTRSHDHGQGPLPCNGLTTQRTVPTGAGGMALLCDISSVLLSL